MALVGTTTISSLSEKRHDVRAGPGLHLIGVFFLREATTFLSLPACDCERARALLRWLAHCPPPYACWGDLAESSILLGSRRAGGSEAALRSRRLSAVPQGCRQSQEQRQCTPGSSHPIGKQPWGRNLLEVERRSSMFRTCSRRDLLRSMVRRVETFSFVPLFPPHSLWQGESCCSAPGGTALPSCRAQQSGHWTRSESWALGWCCPLQPWAPQPWLCPRCGSRTRGLHLSQPVGSGWSLSPCLMLRLSWCSPATLFPRKTPPLPQPVLEVQVALGSPQPWVPAMGPSPALGEH